MGKILLICGYISVLATLVHSGADIEEGCGSKCNGLTRVYSKLFYETAESSKKEDKVEVHREGQKIIGISVVDIQGDGESHITDGGMDEDHVTIELKSRDGNGYNFAVEVFAS